MARHTPGPWRVKQDVFETGIAIEDPAGTSIVAEAWPMSGDTDNVSMADDEIAQANARLIAASPELLAACEYVEQFCSIAQSVYQMRTLGKRLRSAIQLTKRVASQPSVVRQS